MISTDKAIEPVSMLGLTKRFAECIVRRSITIRLLDPRAGRGCG